MTVFPSEMVMVVNFNFNFEQEKTYLTFCFYLTLLIYCFPC